MRREIQVERSGLLGPLVMCWTCALQFHSLHDLVWRRKKNIYCFIVIVNNSSRERERDQGNPHKRMTQKKSTSPSHTHTKGILQSQLIMCCFPLPLCSVVLSLSRAPSPPLLPGCPGDSERHFFPEAPLSPMALFSLLCWLAHRWRKDEEGDAGRKPPQAAGGRQ